MAAEPIADHGAGIGHQRRRADDRLQVARCAIPTDPRDNRLRPSIHVRYGDRGVLIDTTPDFRYQALRAHIERVDAMLFTHSHADHVMGLDDVRPFNFRQGGVIPIYGSEETIGAIRGRFPTFSMSGTRSLRGRAW